MSYEYLSTIAKIKTAVEAEIIDRETGVKMLADYLEITRAEADRLL